MARVYALVFVAILVVLLASGSAAASVQFIPAGDKLPPNHPVIVLVRGSGSVSVDVSVSVKLSVECEEPVELPQLPSIPGWGYSGLPGVPVSFNGSVHRAVVLPGLPAAKVDFEVTAPGIPPRSVKCTLIIGYRLDIDVYSGGERIASKRYDVEPGVGLNLLPLVAIGVETPGVLPTVPEGFAIPLTEKLRVIVVAVDDDTTPSPYVVVEREGVVEKLTPVWIPEYRLMVEELLQWLQQVLDAVSSWVESVAGTRPNLPTPVPGIYAGYVELSGEPGTAIEYYAVVETGGAKIPSLHGIVFVYNNTSPYHVLVIDARLPAYLLAQVYVDIREILDALEGWGLAGRVLKLAVGNASVVAEWLGFGVRPRWEYLARWAQVYIAPPGEELCSIIDELKPNVVVIASMPFKVKTGYVLIDSMLYGDLSEIKCGSVSLLEKLLSYIREYHAGLVVAMGAINDHEVALCDVETGEVEWLEFGPVGHIGRSVSDANIVEPKTLAAAVGLPTLTLAEVFKRVITEQLCKAARDALIAGYPQVAYLLQLAAEAFGSMPVATYAPFKGEFNVTWPVMARYMHRFRFERSMPDVAKRFGFTGYTLVGWQLQEPVLVYNASWKMLRRMLREAREYTEQLKLMFARLAELVKNVTGGRVEPMIVAEAYNASLSRILEAVHEAFSKANFTGGVLSLRLSFPEYGQSVTIRINISSIVDKLLESLVPRVAAVSEDYLGGMLVYDVAWRPDGYRAVLVTFEPELLTGDVATTFWRVVVEWVSSWSYKPELFETLGGLVIPKKLAEKFREVVEERLAAAKRVSELTPLIPERGFAKLNLTIEPGKRLVLAVLHPESEKLKAEILCGDGRIAEVVNRNRTSIVVVEGSGLVCLGLSADADSVIVRGYIEVYEETAPSTVTTTVTTTKTVTTTVTETRTVTTTREVTKTVTKTETVTMPTTITRTVTSVHTVTETSVVTSYSTVTEYRTTTVTLEKPYTVTTTVATTILMRKTYTVTLPGGTATVEVTVYKPTTVTTTLEKSIVRTVTTTVAGGAAGATPYALAAALLVVGLAVGFALGRRR